MTIFTKPELELVKCNLCGADSTEYFFTIKGFKICKCRSCGLMYVNPRPKVGVLHEIYDASYFSNKDNCFTNHYFGYYDYEKNETQIKDTFRPRLKMIEKMLGGCGKLLDIGCAMGFFLSVAKESGWQTYGTDISKEAVEMVEKDIADQVFCGTVEQAQFKDKSFDAITMWDVIEHLSDPIGTLRVVNRLMKKGGVLALVTPDAGSLAASVLRSKWPEFQRVEEHIYFFSKKTLAAMLEKNGFKVEYSQGAGRIFDIPSILSELKIYNFKLFTGLSRLSRKLGLSHVKIYVKPGYKFAMYAKKVSDIL